MNNQVETIKVEEDAQTVAAANRRGLESSVREAHAVAARYDRASGDLALTLRGGARLLIATELLQGVAGASPELIERVELWGSGAALHWEELDADLRVQDIVAGSFGTRRWMAQLEARGLLDEASIERRRQVAELVDEQKQNQVQRAAAAMGRIGGAARTRSKAEAARANGAKGGRPRKPQIVKHDSSGRIGEVVIPGQVVEVSQVGEVMKVVSEDGIYIVKSMNPAKNAESKINEKR